ncbi:hypothetical protein [Nioella ostreopsis]|uniref:hypothetical protein n=1 Tax=Nioella ostreopsis TaxID=2448479 RepID=UPI001F0B9BCF|nr:hypothetical protein [Nioella ostreopsis]
MQAFLNDLDALPFRTVTGTAHGRRYVVVKSGFSGGASQKLVAEELGGRDYISLNLYRTRNGALLRPCEMPEAKVIAFVLDLRIDAAPNGGRSVKRS